jgi:hypothetical protein
LGLAYPAKVILKSIKGAAPRPDDVLPHGIRMVRPVHIDETLPNDKKSTARSIEKLSDQLVAFLGASGAAAHYEFRKAENQRDDAADVVVDDVVTATGDAKHLLK